MTTFIVRKHPYNARLTGNEVGIFNALSREALASQLEASGMDARAYQCIEMHADGLLWDPRDCALHNLQGPWTQLKASITGT